MSPRVVLHIGTNKTGTSAIQSFFNSNRELLKQEGVLYPEAGVGCYGKAHYDLSSLLGFGPRFQINEQERLDGIRQLKSDLYAELSQGQIDTVVLSSENFMLAFTLEPVVRFFEGFDVQVVVYLRRHDYWRESAYSQVLRKVSRPPWPSGFEGWLEYDQVKRPKYGNYRFLVNRWADAFGKHNLIVRPYEKIQNNPDIVTDFLHTASLGHIAGKLDVKFQRVNEALSNHAMYLLDTFQRVNISPKIRSKLVKYACSLPADTLRQSLMSPQVRMRLVQENSDDYEYIARKYLFRKDGRFFYETLPLPDTDWVAPSPPKVVHLIDTFLRAIGKSNS